MNNIVTRREWIEVMGEGTDAQKLWEGMLGPVMVGQPSWRNPSLDCPATYISAYEAQEYCRRVGGRLPTIAEYHALNIPLVVRGEWGEGPPVGGLICEWVLNPNAPQGTGSSGAYCIVDHAWWHCREYAERRNVLPLDGAMKTDATGFRVILGAEPCGDPRCENGTIVGDEYVTRDGEVDNYTWDCSECQANPSSYTWDDMTEVPF